MLKQAYFYSSKQELLAQALHKEVIKITIKITGINVKTTT